MSAARKINQPVRACSAGVIAILLGTCACAQPPSTSITSAPTAKPLLHSNYGFQSVPGVVPSTSSAVRCDGVCDRISGYDSFNDVVRLSDGKFATRQADDGQSFYWRVGSLSDVSRGRLDAWHADARPPRWSPSIPGFSLKEVVALKESTNVFVGVWEPKGQANGRRLIALFSDGDTRRIGVLEMTDVCIVATVEAPVLALDSQISIHGEMWPVLLIVRPPQAEVAGILGFVLFPSAIKCQAQPGGSSIMIKPQRQDGNASLVRLAAVTPSGTLAQTDAATGPVPIDLDPAEGAAVIGKLQDLQQRLRRGEEPSVRLLSGGPIALGMTTVPPREAFLKVRFEDADFITRVEGVRPKSLKGYSIAVPYQSGKLWCTISVRAWGHDGKIDTVSMDCGAPPPALPPPPPRLPAT